MRQLSKFKLERPSCGETRQNSTMSPMEEENYELLKIQLQVKVNEWDIFINRLKKSAPVNDANLEDMSTRRLKVRNVIECTQKFIPESYTTLSQLRQLKTISRKLWSNFNDIYENYTEELFPQTPSSN